MLPKNEIDTRVPSERIPPAMLLRIQSMDFIRKHVVDFLGKENVPKNISNGWDVTLPEFELLKIVQPLTLTLLPGNGLSRNELRAGDQVKAWKKELGGPIIHLLVPDSAQKELWLAQPILRSWLTGRLPALPEGLVDLYKSAEDTDPNKLRYRAAVIALTGESPEKFQKK